jgi:hypothetical protein
VASPAPAPLRVWLIAAALLGLVALGVGALVLTVDDPWSLLSLETGAPPVHAQA